MAGAEPAVARPPRRRRAGSAEPAGPRRPPPSALRRTSSDAAICTVVPSIQERSRPRPGRRAARIRPPGTADGPVQPSGITIAPHLAPHLPKDHGMITAVRRPGGIEAPFPSLRHRAGGPRRRSAAPSPSWHRRAPQLPTLARIGPPPRSHRIGEEPRNGRQLRIYRSRDADDLGISDRPGAVQDSPSPRPHVYPDAAGRPFAIDRTARAPRPPAIGTCGHGRSTAVDPVSSAPDRSPGRSGAPRPRPPTSPARCPPWSPRLSSTAGPIRIRVTAERSALTGTCSR